MRELDNFTAGFDASLKREAKAAEQKAWDALTPEKQARRLSIIRQIEKAELEGPHGG